MSVAFLALLALHLALTSFRTWYGAAAYTIVALALVAAALIAGQS